MVPFRFSDKEVQCWFGVSFDDIREQLSDKRVIWVTDEHVYQKYPEEFPAGECIILPAGEAGKNQDTVNTAIEELLNMEADRDVFLVGVGGGVVTDMAGYIASIYLRGVKFSFAPTSVLGMVDAAVGGKNGVNVGLYKNQVGVIRQPEHLFYNFSFLNTLPELEWISGFAEIIKHACIRDAEMFQFLLNNSLEDFRQDLNVTGDLIRRNAELKYKVAAGDERESGQRRLLNFGHTLGHAIENITTMPHGFAISIGMVFACRLSEKLIGFDPEKTEALKYLLKKYHLPTETDFDKEKAWDILVHDKKKSGDTIHFILLKGIGEGVVHPLSLSELKTLFFEM